MREESKLSITAISGLSGVDRTTIHKMLSDDRIPPSEEPVFKLAEALALNSTKTKELLRRYQIISLGEETYYRRKDIEDFICVYDNVGEEEENLLVTEERIRLEVKQETTVIRQRDVIVDVVCGLLGEAVYKGEEEISIILQPENHEILNCLRKIGKKGCNVKIQHLVCLDNTEYEWTNRNHNLIYLKNIVPLIVKYAEYEIYYYYDAIGSHINENSVMPYCIITREYLCLLSYAMDAAVLTKNKDMINLYQKQFKKQIEKTEPLLHSIDVPNDYKEGLIIQEDMVNMNGKAYALENAPCMGPYLTKEMVYQCTNGKYISKEMAWKLLQINKKNIEKMKEKRGMCFYFPDVGIEKFARRGRIIGIPDQAYDPIPLKYTIQLLETAYDAMKKGEAEGYMVKSEIFTSLDHVYLDVIDKDHVQFFISPEAGRSQRVVIHEKKTCNAFYDFMESLKGGRLVYEQEEMFRYFDMVLGKLKAELEREKM